MNVLLLDVVYNPAEEFLYNQTSRPGFPYLLALCIAVLCAAIFLAIYFIRKAKKRNK